MRPFGLLIGVVLGVVQGYAFIPVFRSAVRLGFNLACRLFRLSADDPVSPKAIVSVLVSAVVIPLMVMALIFLPLIVLTFLTPEFRGNGFFPAWCWTFIVGIIIFGQREKRRNYFR